MWENPERRVWRFSDLLCARWTPTRKVISKPICRCRASHPERQITVPGHLAPWRRTRIRIWVRLTMVFVLSDAALRTGRGGVDVPASLFPNVQAPHLLLRVVPVLPSHLLPSAVCKFTAPSLFERLGLASQRSFPNRRNALSSSASVGS